MWTPPLLVTIPLIRLCFNSENTVKRCASSFVIKVVQQAQVISAFFWGKIIRQASIEHLKMQDVWIKLLEQTEWIEAQALT